MSTANRRRFPRVRATSVAAHLAVSDGLLSCTVENLSAGGLFVRTERLLDVGTRVTLTLVRPGMKRALQLAGRVRSSVHTHDLVGMGLELEPLAPGLVQRLEELLKELGVDKVEAPAPGQPAAGQPAAQGSDIARLMMQVQGLVMELAAVRDEVAQQRKVLQALQQENAMLRQRLGGGRG